MKFSLTRLFIKRPTLVFVIVALMMFAGILSTTTIVKELYPDVTQPTVTISVAIQRRIGHRDARQHRAADRAELGRHGRPANDQLRRSARPGVDHRHLRHHLRHGDRPRADEQGDPGRREVPADEHHAADGQSPRPDANPSVVTLAIYSQKLSLARGSRSTPTTSSRRSSSKSRASRSPTSAAS